MMVGAPAVERLARVSNGGSGLPVVAGDYGGSSVVTVSGKRI